VISECVTARHSGKSLERDFCFVRSLPCNSVHGGQGYVLPRLPPISAVYTTMHLECSPKRSAPVISNSYNMKSTSPPNISTYHEFNFQESRLDLRRRRILAGFVCTHILKSFWSFA